jgi:tetratricopeptide (TPR) repeat protein
MSVTDPIKRKRLASSVLGLCGLVAAAATASVVFAQDPSDPGDPRSVPIGGGLSQPKDFARTPAEDEVWQLYQDDKLLTARRKVEQLLEDRDDSIVGHYVFAQILRRAEGNLPKAMKQMGKARELYERKYKPTVVNLDSTPWLLHREILYAAQMIAGELERHEYQLQLLDYHDSLYDPRLTAEHAWPLMLLGRYDDARKYAQKAADSTDEFQRSLGRNALCAIEGEAGTRELRFAACLSAYDDAADRARGDDPFARPDEVTSVTVHAYNAALAAMTALRPDEAERLAQAGATRIEFTPANPWRLLVRLYTDQGRMDEAVQALREMQAWRRKMPPHLREQVRAETDVAFATVLLVAGETATGLEVVDRAIANPDRRGLTSSSKEQALGAHALLRRAMRQTHAEVEAERAVWSGTAESARITRDAAERRIQDWADAERIRGVLNDDDRLVASFRMYVSGGLEPVPSWLVGDLVPILGAGVSSVVLEMVREAEQDPALDPYYDAFEAEIAIHRGERQAALKLAERALETLPEFEALLRARIAAIAGEAAWGLGQDRDAIQFWATAMQRDAGVIRRRGLALPAKLDSDASGPVARRVVELLEDSPRFDFDGESGGFTITIQGTERALELCLLEPGGGVLGCASTPPEPEAEDADDQADEPDADASELDDDDYASMTVEAFHARAFAMPVGLSNIDLGSLDGTATISDEANRERMQGLLERVKAESE